MGRLLSRLVGAALISTLVACMANTETRMRFDRGRITLADWRREADDCRYQAQKATASAPVNVAGYREDQLFIACLENKGAIYEGVKQVEID